MYQNRDPRHLPEDKNLVLLEKKNGKATFVTGLVKAVTLGREVCGNDIQIVANIAIKPDTPFNENEVTAIVSQSVKCILRANDDVFDSEVRRIYPRFPEFPKQS